MRLSIHCYNAAVFPKILIVSILVSVSVCFAQQNNPSQNTQVKVNVLNVCTPAADEQQQITSALSQVPKQPAFSEDFEVDRGRSVLDPSSNPLLAGAANAVSGDAAVADFIRLRHDISGSGTYSTVQYSFSRDSKQMVETLVFRVREPKDLLQLSIEDSASSVSSPETMLGATTPATRVKLERFGKPSVVLARCQSPEGQPSFDQSAYEPLFSSASTVLANYRNILGVKTLVPSELVRIGHHRGQVAGKPAAIKHN
jgi:hypothetical protein